MTDQFETVGEVGHAMRGIRDQLALHVKVFIGASALFVTAFGGLFYLSISISRDVNDVRVIAARIEGKLDTVAGDTRQTRADVGEMKTALADAPRDDGDWEASESEDELLARFQDVFGSQFSQHGGPHQALMRPYGSVEDMVRAVPDDQLRALQSECLRASASPEEYSTTILGACAAVVNARR